MELKDERGDKWPKDIDELVRVLTSFVLIGFDLICLFAMCSNIFRYVLMMADHRRNMFEI